MKRSINTLGKNSWFCALLWGKGEPLSFVCNPVFCTEFCTVTVKNLLFISVAIITAIIYIYISVSHIFFMMPKHVLIYGHSFVDRLDYSLISRYVLCRFTEMVTFRGNYHFLRMCISWIFMPQAWKVRRGHLVFGSSVRQSVCPSVCPFIRPSVIPSRL